MQLSYHGYIANNMAPCTGDLVAPYSVPAGRWCIPTAEPSKGSLAGLKHFASTYVRIAQKQYWKSVSSALFLFVVFRLGVANMCGAHIP